ncbi:hypothetical protein LTR87_012597 [Friedmanniomyces endolithicus]|nr:hypothetical protein LTR87_012597 [Friedmanniomyces endolithicus]
MSDNDSASSGLSSVAPEEEMQKLAPIFVKAKKATKLKFPPPAVSPPRPKRPPSPPHEDAFTDNPDIAFIVMFRSRFNDVMPAKLPNYGSQDIERGVTDQPPSPEVQSLLCALLSLVLNRKKPVEYVWDTHLSLGPSNERRGGRAGELVLTLGVTGEDIMAAHSRKLS